MIPLWVLALVVAAAVLLWRLPSPCACERCAFHVHERAERLRQKREREHDVMHKGFRCQPDWPDLYACDVKDCARNPKVNL